MILNVAADSPGLGAHETLEVSFELVNRAVGAGHGDLRVQVTWRDENAISVMIASTPLDLKNTLASHTSSNSNIVADSSVQGQSAEKLLRRGGRGDFREHDNGKKSPVLMSADTEVRREDGVEKQRSNGPGCGFIPN